MTFSAPMIQEKYDFSGSSSRYLQLGLGFMHRVKPKLHKPNNLKKTRTGPETPIQRPFFPKLRGPMFILFIWAVWVITRPYA